MEKELLLRQIDFWNIKAQLHLKKADDSPIQMYEAECSLSRVRDYLAELTELIKKEDVQKKVV